MKILLATDFENESLKAMSYGMKLFSAFENIHYFLVHHLRDDSMESQVQQDLNSQLEELKSSHSDISSSVLRGSFTEEINRFINENEIDLIIMGSRRKENTSPRGSNAVELTSKSQCSVLVIPPDLDMDKKPSTIAFSSDYQSMNIPREALLVLKKLLKSHEARLKVFHVYAEGDVDDLRTEMKQNISHHFVERSDHEFYPVIGGDPYTGIMNFIEKEEPDILTLIPRDRTLIDQVQSSSVTKRMAFEATTPLLVLR